MDVAGRRKAFESALSFFVLFFLLAVSTGVTQVVRQVQREGLWSSPRLDNIHFKVAYPEAATMEKARAGELDSVIGMVNPDYVQELQGLGWNISMQPSFIMGYLGINCRDVAPISSGKYYNYRNRTPGFELYPLNVSVFRYVLHLLIGDQKNAWIQDIYGVINERLDTLVPPANKFWHNLEIPPTPYAPQEAYRILSEAGFSNASGYWICPNGQEMRQIYVMTSHIPTNHEVVRRCVDAWNSFFGLNSRGEKYFIAETVDCWGDVIFYNRDHDIYFMWWGRGRNMEYLYELLHPDTDVVGGYNTPGLISQPLDDYLWMLKYGKNVTTGELISDIEGLRKICYAIQWMLYNGTGDPEATCPYIPLISRRLIDAFKPGLLGWVESSGYGSAPYDIMLPWTYSNLRWNTTLVGGSINWHLNGPIDTFNPGTASTRTYAVMNRLYDSLIVVNPYTHQDLPGAATQWTIEPYVNKSEGVDDGMKVTFWLRRGIHWHDGDPVTAEDAVWNFDFIKSIRNAGGFLQFSDVSRSYVKSVKIDDYCFAVYVNATGLWRLYPLAKNAFKFPRQIWEPYWGDAEAAEAFKPSENVHPIVPGLTCLIGTGPYILVDHNTTAETVHLHINRADYPQTGLPGYWAAWHYWAEETIPADINKDFRVDFLDLRLVTLAEGSYPSCWNWLPEADTNNDGIIGSQDIATVWKYIVRNYKQLTVRLKNTLQTIYEYKIFAE